MGAQRGGAEPGEMTDEEQLRDVERPRGAAPGAPSQGPDR